MQRSHQILGKLVVAGGSGEKLGTTTDLLVSGDGRRVVGLIVSSGILRSENGVLPFEGVGSLGGDVTITKDRHPLVDHEHWRGQSVDAIRSSSFMDKRVVATDGRDLGQLKDLCIDERTGDIAGFEVAEAGFAGLVQRHRVINTPRHVVLGPDLVLIDDSSETARDQRPEPDASALTADPPGQPRTQPTSRTSPAYPVPGQPVEPRR